MIYDSDNRRRYLLEMKLGVKLLKKIISLTLVLLFCAEGFAAVISENDGSAFVTKAEFDSLKNGFQSQLNKYNTTIDAKIDEAIASYISGIKVERTISDSIINSKWQDVTAIGGVFSNSFKVPDLNLQFFLNSLFQNTNTTDPRSDTNFWYIVMHYAQLKYTENWNTIKNCKRNLVTCTGTEEDPKNLIWAGRATRYSESWNISRTVRYHGVGSSGNYWPWLDRPLETTWEVEMRNFTTIKGGGYVSNWDSVKTTLWPITYRWHVIPLPGEGERPGDAWSTRTFRADGIVDNFKTSIALKPDDSNKTTEYDHIINYDGDVDWRVSNASWTNMLVAPDETTIKSSTIKATATLTDHARVAGAAHHNGGHGADLDKTKWQGHMQDINALQVIADDAKFPCIGMLPDKYKGSVILQDDESRDITVDKFTIKKDPPTLSDGFQLLVAKKDTIVEWEPEFSYTYAKNSSGTYVKNGHEVDLYFSCGKFNNKLETTELIKVQVGDETKDFITTTDRKCKVKFKMPKNGLVYVKWVPHNYSTYIDDDWVATLDISKCSTYKYTNKDE